ncbi:hypothetical protein TRFO_31278 [Tritrichomonas foetus]|uniref:F5/8 type C domain-containing protein n=1 Tax=Tritrichomonas foetus TaxID=1144522 RepID=A0A1J4JW61_9EUKA|nr:hypothetical protein TRFO_31278 [Tritrichomonas foetus]|eukprot:OHT01764.1 hypothetical protein TRFO_31278 [Tritrichomonas foetus]
MTFSSAIQFLIITIEKKSPTVFLTKIESRFFLFGMSRDIPTINSDDDINDYIAHTQVDQDMIEAEKIMTNIITNKYKPKESVFVFDSFNDFADSNSSSDDEGDITSLNYNPADVLKYHKDKNFINLPIPQLQTFFSDPQIDVSHPNKIVRILLKIADAHPLEASRLFHCIKFESLSRRSKISVLENKNIDHLFAFPDLLSSTAKTLSEKKHRSKSKRTIKQIPVDGDLTNGVNSYLSIISHGNPYLKGIVNVYGNTRCSPIFYKFNNPSSTDYFVSLDRPFSSVFVDFGDNRPILTKYSLFSYPGNTLHMKSWDISGSNDLLHWDILHLEKKNFTLSKKHNITITLKSNTQNYRYYRIHQLTNNMNGSNELALSNVELFGKETEQDQEFNLIQEYSTKKKSPEDVQPICFSSDDFLYRLFDPSWTGFYESRNDENSHIVFDFIEKKVCVTHYSIRQETVQSSFLRNWKIEGSNDSCEWKLIDERKDDKTLCITTRNAIFECQNATTECYRFIKLTQTGLSTGGDKSLRITMIEFFGSIAFL